MNINYTYELNREWLYDDEDDDPIGEVNFIVPADWLKKLFDTYYANNNVPDGLFYAYSSFNDFIDCYEPESDGEFVYQKAIEDNVLIADLGAVWNEW